MLALSPCRRQYSACDKPLACQSSLWFFQRAGLAIVHPRAKARECPVIRQYDMWMRRSHTRQTRKLANGEGLLGRGIGKAEAGLSTPCQAHGQTSKYHERISTVHQRHSLDVCPMQTSWHRTHQGRTLRNLRRAGRHHPCRWRNDRNLSSGLCLGGVFRAEATHFASLSIK